MAETTRDAEQVMANIRELNEQILEAGPFGGPRVPGRRRAKLRTFADYQDKVADASQSDWLTEMMKARRTPCATSSARSVRARGAR